MTSATASTFSAVPFRLFTGSFCRGLLISPTFRAWWFRTSRAAFGRRRIRRRCLPILSACEAPRYVERLLPLRFFFPRYFARHAGEPNFSFRPPDFFRLEPAERVEERRERFRPLPDPEPPNEGGGGAELCGIGPDRVAIAPPGNTGEARRTSAVLATRLRGVNVGVRMIVEYFTAW
jgi:hypothetical protein